MSGVEDAIARTGWGVYHNFLLAIISAISGTQAATWSTICFALPMAFCDLALSEKQLQNFGIFLYSGSTFGSVFLVLFGDMLERKSVLTNCLVMAFVVSLIAGFSHGIHILNFSLFCLGAELTAGKIISKVYLIENLPIKNRGKHVILTDVIFSLFLIFSVVIAKTMIPSISNQRSFDMRLITWRLMFGLSGAFSILLACATAIPRESPRHLLFKKDFSDAVLTLKFIYSINNSKHSQNFDLRPIQLVDSIKDYNLRDDRYASIYLEQICNFFYRIYVSVSLMFKQDFLKTTLLLIFIRIAFGFELLHVNLVLTNIIHYKQNGTCAVNALNFFYLEGATNTTKCQIALVGKNYSFLILLIFSNLIGHLFALLVVDLIGRKSTLFTACILCCTSGGLLHSILLHDYWEVTIISLIFTFNYAIASSVLDLITIESYPTGIRCSATLGTQLLSKFQTIFFLIFLEASCDSVFIFMATSILVAGFLSLFLEEFGNKPLIE